MSPPRPGGGRRLAVVCLGLLAGALALWGSTRLTWASAVVATARGPVPAEATGAGIAPSLTGVAVLAVAAVAASVAVSGIARRALGLIVVLAGGASAWVAFDSWLSPPDAATLRRLSGTASTEPVGNVVVAQNAAPWLGVLGGLLVLAAGLVLVVADRSLPRMGARYAAPGAEMSVVDPDRAAWDALDEGRDPTVDPGNVPGPADLDHPDATPDDGRGPGRGERRRAV
ncbi:Trp biosynthesis-associated membrane protein [Pseudonocardia sp. T1-2H]|uniref:Trp biosynthesis-associated membrane protein n=1 Tax=Pseudonocardia sp. T1-2H TaxID=3128899 RepID=UPI003100BB26